MYDTSHKYSQNYTSEVVNKLVEARTVKQINDSITDIDVNHSNFFKDAKKQGAIKHEHEVDYKQKLWNFNSNLAKNLVNEIPELAHQLQQVRCSEPSPESANKHKNDSKNIKNINKNHFHINSNLNAEKDSLDVFRDHALAQDRMDQRKKKTLVAHASPPKHKDGFFSPTGYLNTSTQEKEPRTLSKRNSKLDLIMEDLDDNLADPNSPISTRINKSTKEKENRDFSPYNRNTSNKTPLQQKYLNQSLSNSKEYDFGVNRKSPKSAISVVNKQNEFRKLDSNQEFKKKLEEIHMHDFISDYVIKGSPKREKDIKLSFDKNEERLKQMIIRKSNNPYVM